MTYLEQWARLEITTEIIKIILIVIFIVIASICYVMKGDK